MPKPLKIKSFLPHREVDICRRLREIRLSHQWRQPDLAGELRIPRGRLANYEYARAPVKFPVGYSLCKLLNVSLWWLATGNGPKHPFTPIAPSLLKNTNPKVLFSTVYDNQLSALVEARLKELAATAGVSVEQLDESALVVDRRWLGVSRAESHLENVIELICQFAEQMEDDEKLQFAFALERLTFGRNPLTIEAARKLGLTKTATFGKREDVKDQWPIYKRKIQKAVSDLGAKTALANFLGVELAQLSKWLTDSKKSAREPGAEYTLRMIYWVEHPEFQK